MDYSQLSDVVSQMGGILGTAGFESATTITLTLGGKPVDFTGTKTEALSKAHDFIKTNYRGYYDNAIHALKTQGKRWA